MKIFNHPDNISLIPFLFSKKQTLLPCQIKFIFKKHYIYITLSIQKYYLLSFYHPIKLHYSQTMVSFYVKCSKFYYLMRLHYSQTCKLRYWKLWWFYYLMRLHYSQTVSSKYFKCSLFYYLMRLHYSQTAFV